MAKIPCFLCSQELQLRRDKHEKAYFVCDVCGMQIFVRGRQGNDNLKQLIETLRERDFPFREHARVLYEIQAVLTEVRGLEKEIEKLDREGVFDVFAPKRQQKDKTRVLGSLNARIENLLSQLDRIANADAHI